MKYKFLSLILVCSVIFLSYPCVGSAYSNYTEDGAITLVKALDIMVGDENGNMQLDKNVSRAEFSKIAVAMSKHRNTVAPAVNTSIFPDCTFKHWAAPFVKVAVVNGLVTGYPDGTFRPENTVSLEEAVTVMLKLMGYTNEDFGSSWPYGQLGIAQSSHLLDNIDKKIGDSLKRRDIIKLVCNTLVANPKNAQNVSAKYLQELNCNLYEDAIIIATNEQNNSVSPGYVLTSEGTFKIGKDFDNDLIGRKGGLVIENGNDYAGFLPSVQTVSKHVVYSKLSDSIVTYSNSGMTSFKVDSNVTAYLDTNKTTYGSVKNSISTGDTIYLMKDSSGKVDYITVATDNMEGPLTVNASTWYNMFTTDTSSLTVMRDGVRASIGQVHTNDIVYYLKDANTVFAYSKKVTGVYEKATPNRDMPEIITVSGKDYVLETAAAFDKVSSNGNCKIGDTVTLLLGKDGQVADVMTSSASVNTSVAGYLIKTGTKQFTNADGDAYSSLYATLVQPDGTELEVVTKSNYASYINKVMNVTYKDGVATLSVAKQTSGLYGLADFANMKIGNTPVAEGVNILDVTTDNTGNELNGYTVTYMQRLDGVTIASKDILYMSKNSKGEISELILSNVTGDAYKYGVITDMSESGSNTGMSVSNKRYTCDVLGTQYTCNINYGSTFKKGMPAAFILSGNSVVGMKKLNLYSGAVKSINEGTVTVGSNNYLISDDVSVYRVSSSGGNSAYTVLPLNELKNNISDYSVSVYYDKTEKNGGRVRVIVAKSK